MPPGCVSTAFWGRELSAFAMTAVDPKRTCWAVALCENSRIEGGYTGGYRRRPLSEEHEGQ